MRQLSKGCRCCQAGKWLCIFLTYRCGAHCSFCPAPFSDDRIWTEFGPNLDDVMRALELYDYQGIGFSGGDCFLVFDRLKKWLKLLNGRFPDLYYWVYTSGSKATAERMKTLARCGMNEIRFNIAGIGYRHPVILRHIEQACGIFEHVAVEIPSIPEHYSRLIDVLPVLADYGIHYLNLHEYLLSPTDPLVETAHKETCSFNLIGQLEYDKRSIENTEKVIAYCRQNKLPIVVNNCSIKQKEKQMLHRRLCWARRVCQPWEKVSEDGLLVTCCRKDLIDELLLQKLNSIESNDNIFMHPDKCKQRDNFKVVRFMPPMEINGQRILLKDNPHY
jgi:hypothetical protein